MQARSRGWRCRPLLWRWGHHGAGLSPSLPRGRAHMLVLAAPGIDRPGLSPALGSHWGWLPYNLSEGYPVHLLPFDICEYGTGNHVWAPAFFFLALTSPSSERTGQTMDTGAQPIDPVKCSATEDQLWGPSSAEHVEGWRQVILLGHLKMSTCAAIRARHSSINVLMSV